MRGNPIRGSERVDLLDADEPIWTFGEPRCVENVGSDGCDELPLTLLRTVCGRLLILNRQGADT
ncbi:hypothetical protein, partial [Mycobacterium avium]|uniref:hypothetical protein n=1 Tax=Mycobacterium avium TaxID=1764 RepID=UPI001CC401D0